MQSLVEDPFRCRGGRWLIGLHLHDLVKDSLSLPFGLPALLAVPGLWWIINPCPIEWKAVAA